MIDPEVRRHFERAMELITAARNRDGTLMVELLASEDVGGAAGAAIAAAVFARDAFEEVCRLQRVDPDEWWPRYALDCQRRFDSEAP